MPARCILLALDNPSFRALVPWLLIAATALFAAGPWLKPKPRPGAETAKPGTAAGLAIQFATAVYGGFFGAGMGVMMLATLGLTQGGDYHRLNALKNLLSIVIAAVAILVFVSGGVVAWLQALVMVPGRGARRLCRRLGREARAANCGARLRRGGRAFPRGLLFRHRLSDGHEEVRPALAGQPLGFRAPPRGDPGMVAGDQHVRNRPAFELLRPRIVRMFEQPVLEALVVARDARCP